MFLLLCNMSNSRNTHFNIVRLILNSYLFSAVCFKQHHHVPDLYALITKIAKRCTACLNRYRNNFFDHAYFFSVWFYHPGSFWILGHMYILCQETMSQRYMELRCLLYFTCYDSTRSGARAVYQGSNGRTRLNALLISF